MKEILVMIIDDHRMLRESISAFLAQQENIKVVAQTGDAESVIPLLVEKIPEIIMLDINMSPVGGTEILKEILEYSPQANVVCLSMHNQPSLVKRMFGLGAKGYVTKSSAASEMVLGIEEVNKGNHFICEEIKNKFAEQMLSNIEESSGLEKLSGKELEVINHLKTELTSKQIGMELDISPKTVEVHRHHILKKLHLKNTASVINYLSSVTVDF